METLISLFETSVALAILGIIFILALVWLFFYSAIKRGVKNAIQESYQYILKIESDPTKKANITKTVEEDLQEELNNW